MKTFVLSSNHSEAALYNWNPRERRLEPYAEFKNPAGRRQIREVTSDRAGRRGVSATTDLRDRIGKVNHQDFARRVSRGLEEARVASQFTKLIVVAEPHMLGVLRSEFTPAVKARIVQEIPRELVHLAPRELQSYLTEKEVIYAGNG